MNGNGHLSLAEVDLGIKQVLRCESLFNTKPVLIRAFNTAKNFHNRQTGIRADTVQFKEFRALLWYLRQYIKYWCMFSRIDTSHDHRVSFQEVQSAVEEMRKWGIVLAPGHVQIVFEELDADGKGMILFDEFCTWAITQHLDLEDDDPDSDDSDEGTSGVPSYSPLYHTGFSEDRDRDVPSHSPRSTHPHYTHATSPARIPHSKPHSPTHTHEQEYENSVASTRQAKDKDERIQELERALLQLQLQTNSVTSGPTPAESTHPGQPIISLSSVSIPEPSAEGGTDNPGESVQSSSNNLDSPIKPAAMGTAAQTEEGVTHRSSSPISGTDLGASAPFQQHLQWFKDMKVRAKVTLLTL